MKESALFKIVNWMMMIVRHSHKHRYAGPASPILTILPILRFL